MNNIEQKYIQYKNYLKQFERDFSNEISEIEFRLVPTIKKIVLKNGIEKETLETLIMAKYLLAFYKMIKSKGYKLPKRLVLMEETIPRDDGIAGICWSEDEMVFNPVNLKIFDPRVLIHELGHLLDMNRITNAKLIFYGIKDGKFKHLSQVETKILEADYKRAYQEGFFKYNPINYMVKSGFINNRIVKDFRKNAEKHYLPNSISSRTEFIADYFSLAAKGFKFSPEIQNKYIEYNGPEIKTIITNDDLDKLEKYKKQLLKNKLSDFGISFHTADKFYDAEKKIMSKNPIIHYLKNKFQNI